MTIDYDSILTSQDSNIVNSSEFYKTGKALPDHGIAVVERSYSAANDDYIVGGLLFMLFIMATILHRSRSSLLHSIKDFFTSKRTYSDEKSNESTREPYNIFMLISISVLSLTLVCFNSLAISDEFDKDLGIPYWLFAAGYAACMAFIYLKAWVYALVNWTFFDHESSTKWMHGYLLVTSLSAFVILPLSLVAVFFESSMEIVTLCFTIVYILYELLLFFKLFVNFESKKYGYLLIILYFCSVELMPTIAMSRILVWVNDSFIVKNLLY